MFGLTDGWIILAYILMFLSAGFCVFYGIKNWNKGGEEIEEDREWGKEEKTIEKDFE